MVGHEKHTEKSAGGLDQFYCIRLHLATHRHSYYDGSIIFAVMASVDVVIKHTPSIAIAIESQSRKNNWMSVCVCYCINGAIYNTNTTHCYSCQVGPLDVNQLETNAIIQTHDQISSYIQYDFRCGKHIFCIALK